MSVQTWKMKLLSVLEVRSLGPGSQHPSFWPWRRVFSRAGGLLAIYGRIFVSTPES
jgi:hypothetical protein